MSGCLPNSPTDSGRSRSLDSPPWVLASCIGHYALAAPYMLVGPDRKHETLEFARRWIPSLSEANYLTSGPNGCMGVGVPFALGAKVACPDRPVFVLMGDGGFSWHGMEYDTLIRHEIPVVGIVFNNAGFTGRPAAQGLGRELGFQRYDLMVAGFGGHGEFVERPEDIAPALQRAIASGKPALVNVCVDPEAQASGGLLGALGSEQAAR